MELLLASEQLRAALEGKEQLRVGLMAQVRRAQLELKVLSTALAEGERERQGIELAFEDEHERRLRRHQGAQHASALVSVTSRLTVLVDDGALRWALHTWAAAAPFAEMGVVFGVVTQRVQALAFSAAAMEREVTNLQLAEAGGLAIGELQLLHDTTTESLLTELKSTEEASQLHERLHAAAATKLRKRESDLVLLIQSYEDLRDQHTALSRRVESAEDGSAAHAARLASDLAGTRSQLHMRSIELNELVGDRDELREALRMRERQLALMLTQMEAVQVSASDCH